MALLEEVLGRVRFALNRQRAGARFDEVGRNVCYYCGRSLQNGRHKDHLYPWSRGGPDASWNYVWSCPSCNLSKKAEHPIVWLNKNAPEMPDDVAIDTLARLLCHWLYLDGQLRESPPRSFVIFDEEWNPIKITVEDYNLLVDRCAALEEENERLRASAEPDS